MENYLKIISKEEGIPLKTLKDLFLKGEMVIFKNLRGKPLGIGKNLKVKVNANLGTSPEICDMEWERRKLKEAIKAGTDTIMDLSTGGDLDSIRKMFLEESNVPVGTVPIYQAVVETIRKEGALFKMKAKKVFEVIERHAKDGVDFVTVHCGVNRKLLEEMRNNSRIMDMVSRGGAFHITWMVATGKENPLFENYDDLLAIAKEYNLVLSLGDGFRPGALEDANDKLQMEELLVVGELVEKAREEGVQVIVEGPGHVPLHEIEANVLLEKKICKGAPYYVLGPLVTDIALGYDHISAAIGGAIAGKAGADFLCYVTPGEHLRLPTPEDVREGVIAARIAAHAADLARGIDRDVDKEFSKAREDLDWKKMFDLCIDSKRAKEYRKKRLPMEDTRTCSMCGNLCAIELVKQYLKK